MSVWVPDYFCDGALTSVRRSGAQLSFYPVTRTLSPDWDVCRDMAARQRPDLFLLVHYFGRAADVHTARSFCDDVGALLFEDAAHVAYPQGAIGRLGDLVCYSPYKFFPVPDGGLLAVRGAELSQRITEAAAALPRQRVPAGNWVAKRIIRAAKRRIVPSRRPPHPLSTITLDTELIEAAPFQPIWMSGYSRWRLQRLMRSTEAAEIAETMRAGHRRLATILGGLPGATVTGFDEHEIPYLTVLQCDDEAVAARYLQALRAKGAAVVTWPRLPPEVKADPIRHREAVRLRRTALCFLLQWRGQGQWEESLPRIVGELRD